MWSAIKFHLFRPEARKEPSIFELDETILNKIYEKLTPVDQVCISLSCKRFFKQFDAKREKLLFPRLLSNEIPELYLNKSKVLRNQLLVRLENNFWACCGSCLKLHPRKEFSRLSLKEAPLERSCTVYAGIADLCPCVALTLRDRARIIKFLKTSKRPIKNCSYEQFSVDFDPCGRPILLHNCSTDFKTGYRLIFHMVLYIESDQLITRALYTIDVYFSQPSDPEPILVCPHKDLLLSLERNKIPGICACCGTIIKWLPDHDPYESTSVVSVDVIRALGRCAWSADDRWFKQCRFASMGYLTYRLYSGFGDG